MTATSEHEAFIRIVEKVISVPRDEMKRREDEYRKRSEANPRKRGPKRKNVKLSASPGLGGALPT